MALVLFVVSLALGLFASSALAGGGDPLEKIHAGYTRAFYLPDCTWSDTGSNRYFILEPGFQITLEGTECDEDEGEEDDEGGARPGIVMPGRILIGGRFFQEIAPGVAMDRAEILAMGVPVETPFREFPYTVMMVDSSALDPGAGDLKFYAAGIGIVIDEELELVDVVRP